MIVLKCPRDFFERALSAIYGYPVADVDEVDSKVVQTPILFRFANTQQKQAHPRPNKGLRQAHRNASCGFFGQAKVNGRNAP